MSSSTLAGQIPYALFVISLFLAYGTLVRRGVVSGRGILAAGALVGAAAVAASFFNIPAAQRQALPLPVLLSGPVVMALCSAFCVAFAYRAQQVVDLARFDRGDTRIIVRYAPASRIEADVLLLPAMTSLRLLGGVAGAVGIAAGAAVEREARARGPIGPGKVVATGAGRLSVGRVFHAAAYDPGRPADAGALRRALENGAQQARKAGAETVAVPVGSLPGLPLDRVAAVCVEALLKHRHAFSEIVFVALEVRSGPPVRDAIARAMAPTVATPPAEAPPSPTPNKKGRGK
jgi:O-acetyl-ADP-ribose deacetylase (regulator of RNase III)